MASVTSRVTIARVHRGRRFRDLLGEINQRVAAVSTAVVLMVAGIPMAVKGEIGVRSAERIAV